MAIETPLSRRRLYLLGGKGKFILFDDNTVGADSNRCLGQKSLKSRHPLLRRQTLALDHFSQVVLMSDNAFCFEQF
jgi:hypothetical protein